LERLPLEFFTPEISAEPIPAKSFLQIARLLREEDIRFCFAVRGNRSDELRAAVGPTTETCVSALSFPSPNLLQQLTAADIHLVSLRHDWTGVVVPSKFFGSLAAGRPVIFAGSRNSCVAKWIVEYQVGWFG